MNIKNNIEQKVINDNNAKYMNPDYYLEYFEEYKNLLHLLQNINPTLFSVLPKRQIPKASQTTDFDSKGYLIRTPFMKLSEDINLAINLIDNSYQEPKVESADKIYNKWWVKILAIPFLITLLAGIFGPYLSTKLTDNRKEKENDSKRKDIFCETGLKMLKIYKILQEIIKNSEYELIRVVVILTNRRVGYGYSGKEINLYEEECKDLLLKMKLLEKNGFVKDITSSNTTKYEMTEEFVKLLSEAKLTESNITFIQYK
jgi:hypothetical protein